MARKKKSDEKPGLLTPLELEIMTELWKRSEGGVHDILESLPKDKDYAYTTVSTVLRILLGKGIVEAKAHGRQHTYVPLLSKEEYESRTLNHVVATVFDNEPASLLRRLLDDKSISKEQLEELKSLIDSRSEG